MSATDDVPLLPMCCRALRCMRSISDLSGSREPQQSDARQAMLPLKAGSLLAATEAKKQSMSRWMMVRSLGPACRPPFGMPCRSTDSRVPATKQHLPSESYINNQTLETADVEWMQQTAACKFSRFARRRIQVSESNHLIMPVLNCCGPDKDWTKHQGKHSASSIDLPA